MNLEQALSHVHDNLDYLLTGQVLYIRDIPFDTRNYLLTRGIVYMERNAPSWGTFSPMGETLYREMYGVSPYAPSTLRRMLFDDQQDAQRALKDLCFTMCHRPGKSHHRVSMAQMVRARVSFYLGHDGQRPAAPREII